MGNIKKRGKKGFYLVFAPFFGAAFLGAPFFGVLFFAISVSLLCKSTSFKNNFIDLGNYFPFSVAFSKIMNLFCRSRNSNR
jgi:hypothetical protein